MIVAIKCFSNYASSLIRPHTLSQSCIRASFSSNKSDLALNCLPIKPRVIFVLGGPGAGKGTQCEYLVSEYGMKHLSAGELLRQEMSTPGSANGQLINNILKEGKIVPVRITLDLLKHQMLSVHSKSNRFLIDGFPRNWDNVQGWEESMNDICLVEKVIVLECDEIELEKRLLQRGLTSGRSDDTLEVVRKRFATFKESTLPVVEYYSKANKVVKIDGSQSIHQTFRDIQAVVDHLIELEIVELTQLLLNSISTSNSQQYVELSDPSLIGIGPEGKGGVIQGLEYHITTLNQLPPGTLGSCEPMIDPRVRVLGKTAIISYKRIVKSTGSQSKIFDETRVWNLIDGAWKQVHYHRSLSL